MFRRIALLAGLVLVSLVEPVTARASAAPVSELSIQIDTLAFQPASLPGHGAFDEEKFHKTRRQFITGVVLGLVGPAVAVGGGLLLLNGLYSGAAGQTVFGVGIGLVGLGVSAGGMALAISGAWANAGVLRRGGVDVSVGLSIASVVVPAVCFVAGVFLPPLIFVGYVSAFALSGAQLGVTGGKFRQAGGRRQVSFAMAPAWNGHSPGVAVTARW